MAVAKGWWDGDLSQRVLRLLEWLHEEVDEAETAFQERGFESWYSTDEQGLQKPEGFFSELADIRLILDDLVRGVVVDFVPVVAEKLDYNQIRTYRRDRQGKVPLDG